MKPKLIIFDLDGVLIDSTRIVADYFVELQPKLSREILNEWLCENFHSALKKFSDVHGEIESTDEQENAYIARKAASPLFLGVRELLEELKACNYILAINTSAEPENCLPGLKQTGIKDFFDVIAHKGVSRSKVEKFKILGEKYSLKPEEIIFVTDTLGDLREADLAGIPTIAVTYGAHNRSFFERERHDNLIAIVDSVGELGKSLL